MNQYSIIELMENSFKKNRDKIAIIDDSQQYTYGEFEEIVNIVANNIYSNNLQKKENCHMLRQVCQIYCIGSCNMENWGILYSN